MAYLDANVKEELYIELPEDYCNSCDQADRLQKAMYGLVHAGLLWLKMFSAELAARGVEQCQANPCVFRRIVRGKVVVNIVVYVDDLLMASETKRDEEQAVNRLRPWFPIKDLGEAGFYIGCHITRNRDAGTLNPTKTTTYGPWKRREDQHHAGSSGSKTPVQGRCPTGQGGDGKNVCHPLPGGGRGPHVGCDHDQP